MRCASPARPAGCRCSTSGFDFTEQYTFWSGTIAALFLFLSYFGTDQSQVQRYLSAKSVDEARSSLLMSAFWKIPLQALVLIVGVLMFTFYLFTPPPMLFNPVHDGQVRPSARAGGVRRRSSSSSTPRSRPAQGREAAAAMADARRRDRARRPPEPRSRPPTSEVKRVRADAVGIVKDVSGDRPTTTSTTSSRRS